MAPCLRKFFDWFNCHCSVNTPRKLQKLRQENRLITVIYVQCVCEFCSSGKYISSFNKLWHASLSAVAMLCLPSQSPTALVTWKVHNNSLHSGNTDRSAPRSEALSSVMKIVGPAVPITFKTVCPRIWGGRSYFLCT